MLQDGPLLINISMEGGVISAPLINGVSKKKRFHWGDFTGPLCSIHLGDLLYLEPQTTIYKLMFGETTIFYIKIWNHPTETSIYKWLFRVPGHP